MVCGNKLVYVKNASIRAKCVYCGKEEFVTALCVKGHYVCDKCHGGDILSAVEALCKKSALTDPGALLLEVFALPGLNMHGPEYHSIVPAVLVTAYLNCLNRKDAGLVKEAIRRGAQVCGGACGTHGACGAAIGVGIAYSVIHGTTPYARKDRGEANRATALALLQISQFGGPRCCKRDSMLAVNTAKTLFEPFLSQEKTGFRCGQFIRNSMCIQERCPFYPR
jgi:hypothetical protein